MVYVTIFFFLLGNLRISTKWGTKWFMLQYFFLLGNLRISTKWADNCVKYVPALMKSVCDLIRNKFNENWLDRQKMGFLRDT